MKFNQEFLKRLAGLTIQEARKMVEGIGFVTEEYPNGSAISAQARDKTVILYTTQGGAIVISAQAGDNLQLEDYEH